MTIDGNVIAIGSVIGITGLLLIDKRARDVVSNVAGQVTNTASDIVNRFDETVLGAVGTPVQEAVQSDGKITLGERAALLEAWWKQNS